MNLAELTGPEDPARAEEAAAFLEAVLPNIYFAMFDIQKAINQEQRPRDTRVRLAAPPDIELLLAVGRERPDDFQPFTIAPLIKAVAAHRNRLGKEWNESNQNLAEQINQVKNDPVLIDQAKKFTGHQSNLPTLAVAQELLRPVFLDKTKSVSRNDAGDIHHAIISIAYCDYVLLDGKWESHHASMVRRFAQLELPIQVAKVFSQRRNGVESFLNELEGS